MFVGNLTVKKELSIKTKFQNTLLLALSMVALPSCAPSNNTKTKPQKIDQYACEINRDLIHKWEVYGELNELEFPFQKVYEGCGKRLIYIAAQHENNPDSKTFEIIETAFRNNTIGFAIVEGFSSDVGTSPGTMIEYANRMRGTLGDAESYLTIRLATNANIKFQGGEPSDKRVMDIVSNSSVTPTDLLGFYIVRQIPQLIRREQIYGPKDSHLNDVIFNMVGSFSEQTGVAIEDLYAVDGIANFSEWYKATNGVSFEDGYREEDSWPSVTDPEFFRTTNRISNVVGNARDQHIVGIIDAAMRDYDTVLVVYGGSHHTIQKPAFMAAFEN